MTPAEVDALDDETYRAFLTYRERVIRDANKGR